MIFKTSTLLLRERKKVKLLSHVGLFATPWTVAYNAPLSMGFSRQEFWSGLPLPPPEDLPDAWIELGSPTLWADALPSEPPGNSRSLCASSVSGIEGVGGGGVYLTCAAMLKGELTSDHSTDEEE